jgi:hypothetical protein
MVDQAFQFGDDSLEWFLDSQAYVVLDQSGEEKLSH